MRSDPQGDENCPHDQGADNAPEKDFVLVEGGDPEVGEDQEKDEHVVDAQGLLDQVARSGTRGPCPAPARCKCPTLNRRARVTQTTFQIRDSLIVTVCALR